MALNGLPSRFFWLSFRLPGCFCDVVAGSTVPRISGSTDRSFRTRHVSHIDTTPFDRRLPAIETLDMTLRIPVRTSVIASRFGRFCRVKSVVQTTCQIRPIKLRSRRGSGTPCAASASVCDGDGMSPQSCHDGTARRISPVPFDLKISLLTIPSASR